MTPVFGHGRLRLYLLKLLEESPRHGYEIIQQLRERFAGLYSPSAGTVYPRLARLETEGLIRHESDGGRKVYRITDAGRAELAARADELAELETEIRASARDLAEGIRQEVRETAKAVQQELADQARRAQQSSEGGKGAPGWFGAPPWAPPQPPTPPPPQDAPPFPGLPGFPPGFPPGSEEWGWDQWKDWKRQQRDAARDWKQQAREQQQEWRQAQREHQQEWKQRQRDWQRDWKEQWARQWKEQWQQQEAEQDDEPRIWGAGGFGVDLSQLGELFGYLRRQGGPVADALRRRTRQNSPLTEAEQARAREIVDRALADLLDLLDGPKDAPPEP
ncbi:PadR family transcriptional regulator [Actinospica robiniae]|uniref:PadR family transcriptional regulator n=1 Tax=Actinospica robiniae TaxID=304901 RepID=UPI00040BD3C1|nr:PadR family transcriptional regulator [Actinospica robiniae]